MKNLFCLSLLCLLSFSVYSQDTINRVTTSHKQDDIKYCDPTLPGAAPSRGAYISFEHVGNSSITTRSKDTAIGNGSGTIKKINRVEFKTHIPILLKPSLKIVAAFRYQYEEFTFRSKQDLDYSLYNNLQNKSLNSIGLAFNMLKSLNETNYFVLRVSGDLNGDYRTANTVLTSYLRVTAAALYGWKKCGTKTTAIGLYYNYVFGRVSLAPVYLYNNTFSKKWGVEILAPATAKVRYNFTENSMLYFGYDIVGASYNIKINDPVISQYPSLQLRRSSIRYEFDYTQQLYRWLWLSLSGGIRQVIGFNITTRHDKGISIDTHHGFKIKQSDPLIKNTVGAAPFFNVTLFVSPSKRLEDRIINAR